MSGQINGLLRELPAVAANITQEPWLLARMVLQSLPRALALVSPVQAEARADARRKGCYDVHWEP